LNFIQRKNKEKQNWNYQNYNRNIDDSKPRFNGIIPE